MMAETHPGPTGRQTLIDHYRRVDPHAAVAASKTGIYRAALTRLNARVKRFPRKILDVGCAYGDFLAMAAACGWRVQGVDILPEGIRAAREKIPAAALFPGDLREAHIPSGSLDAVTLWDVLDQLEDPAAVLAECRRILAPGGTIAIRVRNGQSQLWIYRLYAWLSWVWTAIGIKPFFAFHRFSFTRNALERLLAGCGFNDLSIGNSPLTRGDPYRTAPSEALLQAGKRTAAALCDALCRLTRGRTLLGPSLWVWARRPEGGRLGSGSEHV
jgi:SAM-dependent methyltransferase